MYLCCNPISWRDFSHSTLFLEVQQTKIPRYKVYFSKTKHTNMDDLQFDMFYTGKKWHSTQFRKGTVSLAFFDTESANQKIWIINIIYLWQIEDAPSCYNEGVYSCS